MRLFIAAIGVAGSFLMLWHLTALPLDLSADWAAAQAISDGVTPYQPSENFAPDYGVPGNEEAYPRTPGALLLGMPLALLPYSGLRITGYLLVVIGLIATAVLLARMYELAWWWLIGMMPLFLLTAPGVVTGIMANPAVLVAPLIMLTLLMGHREDSYLAGVPVGVATVLKMWPWAIAAVLFFSGRRKMGVGAAVSFGLVNLAGLLLPGISLSGAVDTLRAVTWRLDYGDNGSLAALIGSTVVAQLLLVVAIWWLSRFEWEAAAVASVAFALFLAPLLWPTYLIPEVIVLVWAWRQESKVPLLAAVVSLLWVVVPGGTVTMVIGLLSVTAAIDGLRLMSRPGLEAPALRPQWRSIRGRRLPSR